MSVQRSGLQLGTLDKAYKILDLYSEYADSLTFSEIVEKTGLERGSVQRLLFTLEHLGLLKRHQRFKRYMLSARFLSYACSFLQTDPLLSNVRKHIEPLIKLTTESVSVSILDGVHVFYISEFPNVASNEFALLSLRRLAISTAAGRAMLSMMPEVEVENIITNSPFKQYTPKTVTDHDEVRRLVALAREEGVAWQIGEVHENEIAVAAPILGEGGTAVGAVTVSIRKDRLSLTKAKLKLTHPIKVAAENLSSSALSRGKLPPSLSASRRDKG